MLHQSLIYSQRLIIKSAEEAEKFHHFLWVCEKECKQTYFPVDLLQRFMPYSVLEKDNAPLAKADTRNEGGCNGRGRHAEQR